MMIIDCINCNKKFEVNSELIPSDGRTIQCGSCNHIWFFRKPTDDNIDFSIPDDNKKNHIFTEKRAALSEEINIKEKNNNEIKKIDNKRSNFSFGKLLSYILVLIISFVALIIIIDTFKVLLYEYFPKLELIMFNFFEIFKDIKLFIKDLI